MDYRDKVGSLSQGLDAGRTVFGAPAGPTAKRSFTSEIERLFSASATAEALAQRAEGLAMALTGPWPSPAVETAGPDGGGMLYMLGAGIDRFETANERIREALSRLSSDLGTD